MGLLRLLLQSLVSQGYRTGTNPEPTYWGNVRAYKDPSQYPNSANFFREGNRFPQWVGKVAQDTRKRGITQGLQDISNPIIMNPYIRPFAEPAIGAVRTAIHKNKPSGVLGVLSRLFQ